MSVYGIRIWVTEEDGSLWSPRLRMEWAPGLNVAECSWGCPRPPSRDCVCGFYARSELVQIMQEPVGWTSWDIVAVGIIAGSGLVQLHKRGFRAEKARIVALADTWTPYRSRSKTGERIREKYPDAAILPSIDAMLKEFPLARPKKILREQTA